MFNLKNEINFADSSVEMLIRAFLKTYMIGFHRVPI